MRSPRELTGMMLLSILILAAAPGSVRAEETNVIIVSTTLDGFDAFDGQCSLREALRNANINTVFSLIDGECPRGSGSLTDVIILLETGNFPDYRLTLPGEGDNVGDLDILNDPTLPSGLDDLRIETTSPISDVDIWQDVDGQRLIENHGAQIKLKGTSKNPPNHRAAQLA